VSYSISIKNWLVKDEESVKNHIEADDYFGTLATILDLIKQENLLEKDSEKANKVLRRIKKDLLYLQENYKITQK